MALSGRIFFVSCQRVLSFSGIRVENFLSPWLHPSELRIPRIGQEIIMSIQS